MTSVLVARAVQERLRLRAYDRREGFTSVLTWFVAEGLALRLAVHKVVRDELLVSGDLMLRACLGVEPPFEWQAELLATCPAAATELERRFMQVCRVEVDDGLELALPVDGVGEPLSIAGGWCCEVTLIGRLGRIQVPLTVLVRVDEQFRQKPCDYYFESVLGSPLTARVLACSPTVLAALRLRAAFALGASPAGMNVLWDLHRLIRSGKVNGSLAPDAVADAFREGSGRLWNSVPLLLREDFAGDASRQQVWASFMKRGRLEAPALREVVLYVQRAVWPWLVQARPRP